MKEDKMNPEVRGQKVAVGLQRACRGGTQGRARSGLICTDVGGRKSKPGPLHGEQEARLYPGSYREP